MGPGRLASTRPELWKESVDCASFNWFAIVKGYNKGRRKEEGREKKKRYR